jgi:hypothetical protein
VEELRRLEVLDPRSDRHRLASPGHVISKRPAAFQAATSMPNAATP